MFLNIEDLELALFAIMNQLPASDLVKTALRRISLLIHRRIYIKMFVAY